MVLGKLDRYVQKNEIGTPSYVAHENKFNMDQRLKCQTQNHKNPRKNIHSKISTFLRAVFFSDILPWARETKEKLNKWD